MPSSRSKVARKQQPKPTAKRAKPQRRAQASLHAGATASPLIADGVTTEADLCKWTDWFARFHTDPTVLYIPLALRTVDCVVTVQRQPSAKPQPPRLMRCVREVAKFNGAKGVEWKLITWVPGLPGAQFQPLSSLDEAMTQLEAPPAPSLSSHPGIRCAAVARMAALYRPYPPEHL